ncbi:MAG: hypothetical protein WD250_07325 [Egibacteraceae bacterium]
MRRCLRDAALYRTLPGYDAAGAITISVFIVADEREAQVLTAGLGQSLYGLATVAELRRHRYDLVATDVEEDGVLTPFSDRHADVIVAAYPDHLPPYDQRLRPAERKLIRALLLDPYNAALRVFDPRQQVPPGYHDTHE